MKKIKVKFIEEWSRIHINNEETKYIISNKGRVYNTKANKFIKPIKTIDGYYKINLSHRGKSYNKKIHILVGKYFIPNDNESYNMINHKNGDKLNNIVNNLEWCDNSYNQKHSYLYKLHRKAPEKNPKVLIHMICKLLQDGNSTSDIIKLTYKYRIDNNINTDIKSLILHIKRRKSWKKISQNYNW